MHATRHSFAASLAHRLGLLAVALGIASGAALAPSTSRAQPAGLPDFT